LPVQDPFYDLAERYNSSSGILRQVVRHELVDRARSPNIFRPRRPALPTWVASRRFHYSPETTKDHPGDRMPGEDLLEVLEPGWRAEQRDPYRSVARLIHLVGRKEPIQG
jgi:hypothetical protein